MLKSDLVVPLFKGALRLLRYVRALRSYAFARSLKKRYSNKKLRM